jgi:neutral ceramidase
MKIKEKNSKLRFTSRLLLLVSASWIITAMASASGSGDTYLIGTGIYDMTGPAAEVTMGGFAVSEQKTTGISTRLWARAFIVGDGTRRVVFVSADTWAFDLGAKQELAKKLKSDPELSPFYSEKNVCVSATHSHSSVGGYSHYFLYNVPNMGFIRESMFAAVNGVYEAIKRAHRNLQPGRILVNRGELPDTGWSRSEEAYSLNPAEERGRYSQTTDEEMLLLKFVGENGEELGMVNWFAVHPDTIGPENTLISGDTKGHASYLFEKGKNTDYRKDKTFVAAFAQADSGDCSPNIPFTQYKGSAEWAAKELGIGTGDAESMGFPWYQALGEPDITKNPVLRLVTARQLDEAETLYDSADSPVSGSIDYRHEYVDFRELVVESEGCTTCPGGMGASYSGGSPGDNPSPFPLFPLGITTENITDEEYLNYNTLYTLLGGLPFVAQIIGFAEPQALSPEYKACQAPKPVILPTGLMSLNLKHIPMTPQILPIQILKIGNVSILALPFEITTMAGRRLKNEGLAHLSDTGVNHVATACLANGYASYMATEEEYQAQMYEGAGTFFGPHQLQACLQEIVRLSDAIALGDPVDDGPQPPDLSMDQYNFSGGVLFDDKPLGKSFGSAATQPVSSCTAGDAVSAVFWGAHPRNTLTFMMNQGKLTLTPFAIVEKNVNGTWTPVVYDWDPELTFRWSRNGIAYSKCEIDWDTRNAESGQYRIHHQGHWKNGWTGAIKPYEGFSSTFTVKRPDLLTQLWNWILSLFQ